MAAGICLAQVLWFAPKCFRQIDIDGIDYIGIARHLDDGNFYAAINAFRSPLMSWVIALVHQFGLQYLPAGKLINVTSFLVLLALTYVLAQKLWGAPIVAGVAAILLACARGLVAASVEEVTPDFLFGVIALFYLLVLLRCLQKDRPRDWLLLGALHGLAYLAKAFALPWLAVCTLTAVLLSRRDWRARARRIALAALIPTVVAGAWAAVLHAKYGELTTGTQFRTNLLQWTFKAFRDHHDTTYETLTDTSNTIDGYGVADPMPPGSWPWQYRTNDRKLISNLLLSEIHTVPQVLKEITIVITPGGVVAFVAVLVSVTYRRQRYPLEWQVVMVIAAGTVSLIFAYSMLVFDSRYLYPLIPWLLVVASRFLIADKPTANHAWRRLALGLVVIGLLVSWLYKSSPFRTLTRDFQTVCYDAGHLLRAHASSTLVSIGSGPFPEHGVGWEAGYKAAYFGDTRLIATRRDIPSGGSRADVLTDLVKASPSAIVVWGNSHDDQYSSFVRFLARQFPNTESRTLRDPVLGEVGTAFFQALVDTASGVGRELATNRTKRIPIVTHHQSR